MENPNKRAIFLDRDGVINKNRSDYVKLWDEFAFEDGALAGLARLAELNLPVIVITNQAGVGRGIISAAIVDDIHRRMIIAVRQAGGRIDHVLFCPHHPDEACDCRKPKPGMLLQAAKQWQIDLSRSFFVGDAVSDLEAGWAAGCQTVLVKTGRGKAQLQIAEAGRSDFHVAESLFDAAHWIYQQLVCEQLEQGLTHPMPQLKA